MDPLDLKSHVKTKRGNFLVSTVDLMGFKHPGDTYYETLVSGVDGDLITARYKTIEEARQGHQDTINILKKAG